MVVGVPLLAIAAGLGTWAILSRSNEVDEPMEALVAPPAAAAPNTARSAPTAVPEPNPGGVDTRWLSRRARLIVGMRLSALVEQPETAQVIAALDPLWRPSTGRILESFKLVPRNVRKVTWASADLAAWRDRAVVVIELEKGQDATILAGLGDPVALQIAGKEGRRLTKASWSHPFVVLDEKAIVTGPEDLLRELSDRTEAPFQSEAIGQLVKSAAGEADLLVLLDLAAAREAGWRMPVHLWDIWPEGRRSWHTVWEAPRGMGLAVRKSAPAQSELALVCDGESAAMKVRAALEQLLPAARTAMEANIKSLTERLQAGGMTAREAEPYELFLKQGVAALGVAKSEVVEQTVLVRIDWGRNLPAAVAAALESRPAIRSGWLAAARRADEENQRRLVVSLGGYAKAEGHFPAGVDGGGLLPPDTRLSWIASMLPYFEHRDWHRELQFGYSWNSSQNRPVTQRRLDAVVNPALGPASTEAGFPVTHYVGVAGVGANAADLKPGDARAGLFGYSRTPRLEDLPRGTSHTLATLGVSGQLGAWAAGGPGTVRALTKRPYVNGPDGFGSGQPDGMVAGMADGSVRFLSKEIDPEVLEQLAAVRGGEKAIAALDAKLGPPGAAPGPAGPKVDKKLPGGPAEATPAPGRMRARVVEEDESDDEEMPLPPLDESEVAKIDLRARLADLVPSIQFPSVPMIEAVRLMSRMSTVPVSFDLDWMRALGAGLRDPVTVRLSGATTGEVYQALVARHGLTCEAAGDGLLITAPAKTRNAQKTEKYNVEDLVGKEAEAGGQLAGWVRTLVSPESWREAGGRGTVEFAGGTLVVSQSVLFQRQVADFLDRLRLARGKSPAGRSLAPPGPPPTHLDLARAKLRQPVTLSYPEPTPLGEIATDLEHLCQVTLLFDGPALSAAGMSRQRKATLAVREQPLSEVLVTMLRPLGLTYRMVDATTFEITTRKAASARLELEFHPVAAILARPMTAEALLDQIKSRVAGATWNDVGGPGAILFDKASQCLLVLQSQSVQAKVQIFLGKL